MNSNSDSKSGGVYDCRAGDFSGIELQCDRLGVGRRDSGTQHSRAQLECRQFRARRERAGHLEDQVSLC